MIDKLKAEFHQLDRELNQRVPPKLAAHESGMRYESPATADKMLRRLKLAFQIARLS